MSARSNTTWGGGRSRKEAVTQFERSSQASDNGDRVGRVCAELVQWGEKSVPLVLQLKTKTKTSIHSRISHQTSRYRTNQRKRRKPLTYMLGVGGLSLSLGRAGDGGGGSRGGGHLSRRMLLLESPFLPRFLETRSNDNLSEDASWLCIEKLIRLTQKTEKKGKTK